MKNRLPKDELKFTKEQREEALNLWKMAVDYFNTVVEVVAYFPEHVEFDVDVQVKKAALSISEHFAKGINADSTINFHNQLDAAKDGVSSTLACLWIANQWSYIREDQYNDFYKKGRLLANKISEFGLVVYANG